MLEEGQIYTHPDRRTLAVGSPITPEYALGRIFIGTLGFGPMTATMSVTKEGLDEAGFELTQSAPPVIELEVAEPTTD